MKNTGRLICCLFLGAGLMSLMSCDGRKNRHGVIQVLEGGKLIVHADPGQSVDWVDGKNNAFQVTFPHGSPCEPSSSAPISTCLVRRDAKYGYYQYKCDGCADPGVGVGSVIGTLGSDNNRSVVNVLNAATPLMWCDALALKIDPSVTTATMGDTIQWVPNAPDNITKWTVTVTSGVCDGKTVITETDPVCKVVSSPKPQFSYTVNAPACTAQPNATAYLVIK